MYHQHQSLYLRKLLHLGLSISLIVAVMLGLLPLSAAQAGASEAPLAQPQMETMSDNPPPGAGRSAESAAQDEWKMDLIAPDTGVSVSSEGTLPLPSNAGGSLPGGINSRSLPAGITVDLTYDVVMGWVGAGETVTVTASTEGYGAAVADGTGFFWTPIWHNTDGHGVDIICEMPISITVGTASPIDVTPPCLTGGIDVLGNQVVGTIADDTSGTAVTATLGGFDMDYWTGGIPPAPGAPTISGTTEIDGTFSLDFISQANLGAESLVAVDFLHGVDDINVRSYLYPTPNVFMVHQYHTVAGYAAGVEDVAVTVYEADGTTERWSETTSGSYPHGFYRVQSMEEGIAVGNIVEVKLDGVTLPTIDVMDIGNFDFNAGDNTLYGTAPDGSVVRASLWQWSGEDRLYQEAHATAGTGGTGDTFAMDFSPTVLRSRDEVLVVVPDADGNQVQLASGPPFVSAYISLDTNLDCVLGRLDGPGLPIYTKLDKIGGEVYTRDTGFVTDAGNTFGGCFVMRDGEDNLVNFHPGDIVTLMDDLDTPGWEGSVVVADLSSWSGDTAVESISGSVPTGDMEVTVHQWQDGHYPLHGTATQQAAVSGGVFTAGFTAFDVRDGVTIDFSHYEPINGFATQTNPFSYQPTLPYFQLYTPWGVSGMSATPGETATAMLYDGEDLLAQTSDDGDDHPYSFWLGNFDGHNLQPGYRVEVSTSGGWSAEMTIPDLAIEGDLTTDIITATGPEGLLYLEVGDNQNGMSRFVPGTPATPAKWNLSIYGWDLGPSDTTEVVYQAVEGNRCWAQKRMAEVYDVGFDLQPGPYDGLWGSAKPESTVQVDLNGSLLFTAYADPTCGGCWGNEAPLDINPGDIITVTAGAGDFPVTITVPDPLTANADSSTDKVWGQIGGWSKDWVHVDGWWEDGYQQIMTTSEGYYTADYADVPNGGRGYVRFGYQQDGTWIGFNLYFQTPDLILEVNYAHDWVQGNYEAGHTVTVTVYESDHTTIKATAEMETGPLPWSNQPGFSSNTVKWFPEHPDIQPGDWVDGEVDVEGTVYGSQVQLGTITGDVNVDDDSISGTVAATWLPQDVEVELQCYAWGSPEWVESKGDSVRPNGSDPYYCSWDPATEWDVEPGQEIAVLYQDPDGHWIYDVYSDPAPYLQIEKWPVGGDGSLGVGGNAAFEIQYRNQGSAPAGGVTITDTLVGMTYISDTLTGIDPTVDGNVVTWDVGTVDPNDDWIIFVVYAEVTASQGDLVSNSVQITTTNPYDMGEEEEKTSSWEGTVAANDTHLEVGKGPWTWNPAPDEDFVYAMNVCNNGSTNSSTVTATDTLPSLTTYVDFWSWDVGWEYVSYVDGTKELVLSHPSISAHTCSEVYVLVTLAPEPNATPGDSLINTVVITADNDPDPEGKEATCEHQVGDPYTDLAVYQNFNWGSLTPGGQYRYNIDFNNQGNTQVNGPIQLTATLPAGTSFASWDGWGAATEIPDPVIDGNVITWTVVATDGDLIAGVNGTIEVWVDIDPGTAPGTTLEHLAEIAIQAGETNEDNNTNTLTEKVYPHGPNLRIRKQGQWHGDESDPYAWYELKVQNIGDQTMNDVVITDTYPAGMTLREGPSSGWFEEDPVITADGFTYTVDAWEPGWNFHIQFTLNPDSTDQGIIYTNTATVAPTETDTNPEDNTASSVLFSGPDMYVEKTHLDGEFLPGEEVTYLLRFGNAQTAWWWGMEGNAILTDILPEGMSYVLAEWRWCEDVDCTVTPDIDGQELTWELYQLGSENWNEILLTVLIDEEVDENNPLINQVTISSSSSEPGVDIDPFLENNSSSFDPEREPVSFKIFLPLIVR